MLDHLRQSQRILLVQVSVHKCLDMNLSKELRVEVSDIFHLDVRQLGQVLLVDPSLLRVEPSGELSNLLIRLLKVPVPISSQHPLLDHLESIRFHL